MFRNRSLLPGGSQVKDEAVAGESDGDTQLSAEGVSARTLSQPGTTLVHPVYLDIPMMASFYAAAGLSTVVDQTQRNAVDTVSRRRAEGAFDAKFAEPILELFKLKLRLAGSLEREKRSEESIEIKSLFQHTEASLFNQLREWLIMHQQVHEPVAAVGVRRLREGDLIEISGRVVGNPLEQLVEVYDRLLAYAGVRGDPPRRTRSQPVRRWWWPMLSKKASALMNGLLDDERNLPRMAQLLRDDLAKAQVRDLLVEVKAPNLAVVLVVATEYFTGRSGDYLMGGQFKILGKVTNATYAATPLDFMRRTTLAAMSAERAQKLVQQLRRDVKSVGGSEHLWAALEDGTEPSLQLLPLAIFA